MSGIVYFMSGIIVAAAVTGVTWCFCTATASLCGSWTSGRVRSVMLLALSIVVSLAYQYGLAPQLVYLLEAWSSGCEGLPRPYCDELPCGRDGGLVEVCRLYSFPSVDSCDELPRFQDVSLVEVCAGNAGVYRAAAAAFLCFVIFGIASKFKPTANREAWPAKYILFIFLCVGTIFIPNEPVFIPIFLWIARAGSVLFVLLQQLIIVDIGYNWNSSWLDKSDQVELDEGPGKGKKWLTAILISCAILYITSLAGIIIMFIYFGGCTTNEAFISVTLIMSVVCTVVQLIVSESGSLLTSACMTLYATYLCGAAVSKNPDPICNPKQREMGTWSIVLGMLVAFVSLLWAGWSYTTDKRLGGASNANVGNAAADGNGGGDEEKANAGGVVLNSDAANCGAADSQSEPLNQDANAAGPSSFGSSWKLNAVLALICCWYSMALTGWGAIEKRGNVANPDVGEVSMWMLIVSQWAALLLYLWTLVAPSLFPDRDFS